MYRLNSLLNMSLVWCVWFYSLWILLNLHQGAYKLHCAHWNTFKDVWHAFALSHLTSCVERYFSNYQATALKSVFSEQRTRGSTKRAI